MKVKYPTSNIFDLHWNINIVNIEIQRASSDFIFLYN